MLCGFFVVAMWLIFGGFVVALKLLRDCHTVAMVVGMRWLSLCFYIVCSRLGCWMRGVRLIWCIQEGF